MAGNIGIIESIIQKCFMQLRILNLNHSANKIKFASK